MLLDYFSVKVSKEALGKRLSKEFRFSSNMETFEDPYRRQDNNKDNL